MSEFVPGAELSRRLYDEVVRPILGARFPGLPHSAALLGRGSEVLGFDDEMSTDHDWKPRVLVFLAEQDEPRHGAEVREALQRDLPPTFAGHPIDYEVHTVRGYFRQQLELDIDRDIEPRDWLTLPGARAAHVHLGGGLPRRGGPAGSAGPSGLLPPRRLAVPADHRLVARPPGDEPGRQSRSRGRRAGLLADRVASRGGPHAARLPDGTAVRAVLEMVRNGLLTPRVWLGADARPVESRPRGGLAGPRSCPDDGVREAGR